MITRIFVRLRRIRRWFNRSEWGVRWLGLSRVHGKGNEPGLVLIQIDGLGYDEFYKALQKGQLPFLRKLLVRQGYETHSLYTGLPSTTPAVQAELFYGKKTSVPAFSYIDPRTRKVVKLFTPAPARELDRQLNRESDGLLEEGAAYGNIFGGGAEVDETHFCVSALGWSELRQALNPLTFLLLLLMNFMSVVRILALLLIETGLSLVDAVKGLWSSERKEFLREAKFILARVGVCIGLRELIAIGTSIDITRGLPVIHLNLVGFDEQAHRRGPSSAFAHWGLLGIDHTIKRIWLDAKHSSARDYHVWIYSDHGQEDTVPYAQLSGTPIQTVVRDLVCELRQMDPAATGLVCDEYDCRVSYRANTLTSRHGGDSEDEHDPDGIRVASMGPVGFIHVPESLSDEEKRFLAAKLADEHQVPVVLYRDEHDEVHACIEGGQLRLPRDLALLTGDDHPFAAVLGDDLLALCRHPGAGDLVIAGWRAGLRPVTFALEHGSHGGFGPKETHAFALLDGAAVLPAAGSSCLRPADLRLAALRLLNRHEAEARVKPAAVLPELLGSKIKLRVMTYNVHSCIGMDGRCSPRRIARMISLYNPDIVALQELDKGREKSSYTDQARELAELLDMHFIFAPALRRGTDQYGNALLSRWPLTLVADSSLPRFRMREPRGVLWATLETGIAGIELQLLVTHLGLSQAERKLQVDALMGKQWLQEAQRRGPAVLLGDFNATEWSYTWRRITRELVDVQRTGQQWKPRNTWFSTHPRLRIDHIFVSPGITVDAVYRPIGADFQMASDHLPLLADLSVPALSHHPLLPNLAPSKTAAG